MNRTPKELETLITEDLQRWRAAEVSDSVLAKTILLAIQSEVLRALEIMTEKFKEAAAADESS